MSPDALRTRRGSAAAMAGLRASMRATGDPCNHAGVTRAGACGARLRVRLIADGERHVPPLRTCHVMAARGTMHERLREPVTPYSRIRRIPRMQDSNESRPPGVRLLKGILPIRRGGPSATCSRVFRSRRWTSRRCSAMRASPACRPSRASTRCSCRSSRSRASVRRGIWWWPPIPRPRRSSRAGCRRWRRPAAPSTWRWPAWSRC